jgi:HAD superfamily hydrolase (TIGR01490 family)
MKSWSRMADPHPAAIANPTAEAFIQSVLELRLKVAVFDCDGTLWEGDGGKDFLYWEAQAGLLPAPVAAWALARYASYMRGEVDEETMCGEMVTIHAGLSTKDIESAAETFVSTVIEKRIFPEMRKLVGALADQGSEIWAVSSTNTWVIEAGARRFGIGKERVVAASVVCKNGIATNEIIRVPTGEGKAIAIREIIRRTPDAVFGNSVHDAAMLDLARHPFAINPNPDLLTIARSRDWQIYRPLPYAAPLSDEPRIPKGTT